LDYITVLSGNVDAPKAGANFFKNLAFNVELFINSFVIDYSTPVTSDKTSTEEPLEVWINTGRDQAQILRDMIKDGFTEGNVNVKLVLASALLPSVLSGVGPDVSINAGNDDPVNFAIRSAVEDLTQFSDYEEVAKQFTESAILPFEYGDAVYALPENQTFSMMFYRKDIFAEYGIEVPKTWTDFIYIIPILQRANMQVGLSPTIGNYLTLLYQNGETLYTADNSQVNFGSNSAIASFETFCDFYTQYKIPVDFDFANRFRSGEMPLGIVDYTMYNQLSVFAPEIKGLWEMVPLPGVEQEDGTIKNTAVSTSSGCVMLSGLSDSTKELAWKFMKWWTGSQAQATFGIEMESLLGAAAKQPTANVAALSSLPWTAAEYANISSQMANTQGTPVVPGNYMVTRYFNFAYANVYNSSMIASEELEDTIVDINAELTKKLKEFNAINNK